MSTTIEITRGRPEGADFGLRRQAATAAVEHRAVRLFYRKREGEPIELRLVSPYEVRDCVERTGWYVIGWDHDRGGMRNFSVEKIKGMLSADDVLYVPPEES